MNITLNIIIESKNTGETLYLQILKKGGRKMKSDLFIRNLSIIIVILLALNIILPTLSNPATSYAAKNIEYKVVSIDGCMSELESYYDEHAKDHWAGLTEKLFNEYAKEGWECIGSVSKGELAVFKR